MKVVAAIIVRGESVLICQRKSGGQHGGKWEFPGGKVEAGEGLRAALARELEEELAIQAVIGAEIARYEYAYPDRQPIELIFYEVTEFAGEPANLIFEQIRWESRPHLPSYDFLDGDIEFVKKLAADRP
jgi:8-oxo-dGTP diphosphatase